MVRAEEKIPQDGTPVAHHHVLVQQGGLDDGVDQDLGSRGHRTRRTWVSEIIRLHLNALFKQQWWELNNTARGLSALTGTQFYQTDSLHRVERMRTTPSFARPHLNREASTPWRTHVCGPLNISVHLIVGDKQRNVTAQPIQPMALPLVSEAETWKNNCVCSSELINFFFLLYF